MKKHLQKTGALYLLLMSAVSSYSQNIGINQTGATPHASSVLDLNTGNTFTSPNGKGIMPPNVALTSITDAVTVTSPATSLLVYNTATAGTGTAAVVPGYYYWSGTQWVANTGNDWKTTGNAATTAGTNFIGTTDAVAFVTKTNNTERMRVTSTGNVGIGTAAPTSSLHIVATATNTGFQLQDGTQGAGKVLTSDANGKASWTNPSGGYLQKYTLQSNQTYPYGSVTPMDFPVITIPYNGKYLVNFKSFFRVAATQEYSYYINLMINGSVYSSVETYNYVQANAFFNVTDIYTFTANAGDVISFSINLGIPGTSYTCPLPNRVFVEFLFIGS